MTQLRPTINDRKTRICRVPGGTFRFLGYTIGTFWWPVTGESRTSLRPSPSGAEAPPIAERTGEPAVVVFITRGDGEESSSSVDGVGQLRVTGAAKQGLPGGGSTRPVSAPQVVVQKTSDQGSVLILKPDAANPHVRFEEREVDTEQGLRFLATKGKPRYTEIPQPKRPRHFSTPHKETCPVNLPKCHSDLSRQPAPTLLTAAGPKSRRRRFCCLQRTMEKLGQIRRKHKHTLKA